MYFQCDQCEYMTTEENDHNEHKKEFHEGIHITCDQCDYKKTAMDNCKGLVLPNDVKIIIRTSSFNTIV